MITIVPLDMSPASFAMEPPTPGPWPRLVRESYRSKRKKYPNSVLVVSAKNTKKVTLQIRTSSTIINVWLNGEEAKTVSDALVRKNMEPRR